MAVSQRPDTELETAALIARKKLAGRVAEQVPFIPMSKTSPVVGVLNPRSLPGGYHYDDEVNGY